MDACDERLYHASKAASSVDTQLRPLLSLDPPQFIYRPALAQPGDELLEARIVPQRVPPRLQFSSP